MLTLITKFEKTPFLHFFSILIGDFYAKVDAVDFLSESCDGNAAFGTAAHAWFEPFEIRLLAGIVVLVMGEA